MKKILILISTFSIAFTALSQSYEPQILILSPNEIKFDKEFDSEIKIKNEEIAKYLKKPDYKEAIKSSEFKKQPQNIQLITLSEVKFTEKLDFFKQTSLIAHRYLTHSFYRRFSNLLILLSDTKIKSDENELKALADKEKMQYVLNFSKIELFKKNGISFANITVQLFDNEIHKFVINKVYEGDWINHGFDFACSDKSIECSINNCLSQALKEVISEIASNNPTIKKERKLNQERINQLFSNYYTKSYDKTFLKSIITKTDTNIVLNNLYNITIDSSKTKFVGFFLEQIEVQDFKTIKDKKNDKNVNIISSTDIEDEDFLKNVPKNYAYIVKGVKYNGKWYFEKSNVTYFEAKSFDEAKQQYFNNLIKWGFFKDNSTKFNHDFWETNLFAKIQDSRKESGIEEKGDGMTNNNKSYTGLYEIVANQLKKLQKTEDDKYESKISEAILLPFYEKIIKNKPSEFNKYSMLYDKPTLIYPKERNVFLNPIMITNAKGEKLLHYFVVFADSKIVYEWTYFKNKKIPEKSWHYGSDIVEQLKALTDWNFSFNTLDDNKFWTNYVSLKLGNNYKYLKQIE